MRLVPPKGKQEGHRIHHVYAGAGEKLPLLKITEGSWGGTEKKKKILVLIGSQASFNGQGFRNAGITEGGTETW